MDIHIPHEQSLTVYIKDGTVFNSENGAPAGLRLVDEQYITLHLEFFVHIERQ